MAGEAAAAEAAGAAAASARAEAMEKAASKTAAAAAEAKVMQPTSWRFAPGYGGGGGGDGGAVEDIFFSSGGGGLAGIQTLFPGLGKFIRTLPQPLLLADHHVLKRDHR